MRYGLWLIALLLFLMTPMVIAQKSDTSGPLATLVAPPTIDANVRDSSAELQATLEANSTQPATSSQDNTAELDATLRANDATLAPPNTGPDLSNFLPSELQAQSVHQILVVVAFLIIFALLWKLRQNTVINYNDQRKKKKNDFYN